MQRYSILVSQTSFSAVSVADIRAHLNITDTSTDTYIGTLINAAVDACERATGMDWRSCTWKEVFDSFPYCIDLTRGPLQSVTSIQYYDTTNTLQTVDSTNYTLSKPSFLPGWIEPIVTYAWPATYWRPDAVTVNFTTGFSTVPARGIHAIKLLVGSWWVERESLMYGPDTAGGKVGEAIDCLLGSFKVGNYA